MKIKLFLIALFLLIISVALETYFLSKKKEVKSFQQTILAKEKLAKKKLRLLADDLSQPDSEIDFSQYNKLYKTKGIVLLCYKNDTLLFWSDNHINIKQQYDARFDKEKYLSFNNGKYIVFKQKIHGLNLIALLQVTNEFPLQNKFLKNGLHRSFFNVHNITIQVTSKANDNNDIYNIDGDYLFSIQIADSIRENIWQAYVVSILYLFAFLLFCISFFVYLKDESRFLFRRLYIFLFAIGLCFIRIFMVKYKLPLLAYSLKFFSPTQYASSYYFSSLGDFMLNSLSFFLLAYAFSRYYELSKLTKKKWWFNTVLIGSLMIFIYLFYFIIDLLKNLILDSNFSLQIQSSNYLNQYNIWALLSSILFIYGFLLGIRIFTKWGSQHLHPAWFFILCILIFSLYGFVFYKDEDNLINTIFLFLLCALYGIHAYSNRLNVHFLTRTVIHIITAIYLVHFIQVHSTYKEKERRKTLAVNLSFEYDLFSFSLLSKIDKQLKNDSQLKIFLKKPYKNEERIKQYITSKYFSIYWELFEVKVIICSKRDKIEIIQERKDLNCFDFFSDLIKEQQGKKITNTDFYNLEKFDGKVSYIGIVNQRNKRYGTINLYIDINSISPNEGIGYPNLLLDKKLILNKIPSEYSFAKYSEGKLLISSGAYDYNWINPRQEYKKSFYKENNFNHYIYPVNKNNIVIVSKPIEAKSVYWINLLYVFIFLSIFQGFLWLLEHFPWKQFTFSTFSKRIQIAFIFIIGVFLIITILLTLQSSYKQFKEKNLVELNETLTTLKNEIHQHISSIEKENSDVNTYFTNILMDYSALLKTDINIYDKSGDLVTTSRNEIFNKGLQGRKINPYAFHALKYKKKRHVILDENLGKLKYSSAYVGIITDDNKVNLYLNLPYFQRYEKLKLELLSIIVRVINIYLLVTLICIFISILIANKLTSSLKLIQEKFEKLRMTGENKHIHYTKQDEIKNLVNSYNDLVDKLDESTKALVKSERESAWREMAKQVAHEIKNPLTPMRLSLQFLVKSYQEKPNKIKKQLNRTANLLFEQIEQLSFIATEFSNFASLPKSKIKLNNLVDIVNHVLPLFHTKKKILHFSATHKNIPVLADKKLFERVYLNLIKNAIHAISDKEDGRIDIWLGIKNDKVQSYVKDNGTGIEPEYVQHIFSPSFTTKSGGMGLGLVISKNIINDVHGTISFETKPNKGTTFFIDLPLYKESDIPREEEL